MARNRTNEWLVKQILGPTTMTNSDGKGGTEADMLTAKDCAFIVNIIKGTTGITNVAVHTSDLSDFTMVAANVVAVRQDTNNSTGSVTVTSDITAIATTGIYTFHVSDTERYVNILFDGDDTDSIVSLELIGHNQEQAVTSATSAYT